MRSRLLLVQRAKADARINRGKRVRGNRQTLGEPIATISVCGGGSWHIMTMLPVFGSVGS
jgi:hypothetical protein